MNGLTIGVQIAQPDVRTSIHAIDRAEALGINAAWMTLGGAKPDNIAMMAVAAARTERIKLGTCIVPLYTRHPMSMAQSARVVAELAPGRFRLGVGPSHKSSMEHPLGIPYDRPVGHLREYLEVLRGLLQKGGQVDFEGQFYQIHIDAGVAVDMKIMASALREKSFRLVGETADGAITWLSPLEYVRRTAIPAMESGATNSGRPRPLMVMHIPIVVHEDQNETYEAVVKQFSNYPNLTNYQEMFSQSGFPEAREGTWSARMLDAVIVHGDERRVAEQLERVAAAGIDEVICSVLSVGSDPSKSVARTLAFLGEISARA